MSIKSDPNRADVEGFNAYYKKLKTHIPESYHQRIESAIVGLFRKLIKGFK